MTAKSNVSEPLTGKRRKYIKDYFNEPESCWYGQDCPRKIHCSRNHGIAELCECSSAICLKGHPLRRQSKVQQCSQLRVQNNNVPWENYECLRCKAKGVHFLNECPQNKCYYCGGDGHIATYCPMKHACLNM